MQNEAISIWMCQSRAATCQARDNTPKLRLEQFLFWSELSYSNVQKNRKRWDVQKRRRLLPLTPRHPSCLYLPKTHHDTETKALLHSNEGFNCGARQIRRAWRSLRDNAFTHPNKAKRRQHGNEELEHSFDLLRVPSARWTTAEACRSFLFTTTIICIISPGGNSLWNFIYLLSSVLLSDVAVFSNIW